MNFANTIGQSSTRDLSFFHSLFKACMEGKHWQSPLIFFRQLLQSSSKPNDLTLSLLLKSSVSSPCLSSFSNPLVLKLEAVQIHTHLVKSGFDQFVWIKTALLGLYVKSGFVCTARKLFDEMPKRDIVVWNALICGYSRNGFGSDAFQIVVEMLRDGFVPSTTTLLSLLPSLGHSVFRVQAKSVHALGTKTGIDLDSRVRNAVTSMYAKCGDLESAELLFAEMCDKNAVSWNTIISAYGQYGFFEKSMLVFKDMLRESARATSVTMMSLFSANANPRMMHCFVTKTGLINDASVITSLVCAYSKHGNTESAKKVYESTSEESLVCLTAIASSYAEKGDIVSVMAYFSRMQQIYRIDDVAMVRVLQSLTESSHLDIGLLLHGYVLKTGLCLHTLLSNGLIAMYSKFGDIEAVFSLFSDMEERPLITWNSVISACVQAERPIDAIGIFSQMKLYGNSPDAITIASLLSGCSMFGYVQLGKSLHTCVIRTNLQSEDFVCTALIDMYAKCGSIQHSENVFKSVTGPCLVTWNAMITCYSLCGYERRALASYCELQERGLKPDRITFLGVLEACNHAGLVEEGKRYFKTMTEDFGLLPSLQHCASMVGLLSRAGLFDEALVFIKNMESEPDTAVWGGFLNACWVHSEVELGEYAAKKMYLLDHGNGGLYVLMSNLYAAKGMWGDVARVRMMMSDIGGDGHAGVSVVE